MNLGVCLGLLHLADFSLYFAGQTGAFGDFGMTRSSNNLLASISWLAPIKFQYGKVRILYSNYTSFMNEIKGTPFMRFLGAVGLISGFSSASVD